MSEPLDLFLKGYIECALWTSHGPEEGLFACENLVDLFDADDLSPECLASMRADCEDFCKANAADLAEYYKLIRSRYFLSGEKCAGHDFWLTRNGHGAGFWDRGFGALGDRLAAAAKIYREVDLYPGDDRKIYC